jgi:hypothetical protein
MKHAIDVWSDEKLRLGLDRFRAEHGGLLPTAHQIDDCPYLPSSRHIQRAFGGLRALRERLGYEVLDYTRGTHRSVRAAALNRRGGLYEDLLHKALVTKYGELFVHGQRRYGSGPTRSRLDFLVYMPDGAYGIDVFATDSARNVQTIINLKAPKYRYFPRDSKLYFLVATEVLSQSEIDSACSNIGCLKEMPNVLVRKLGTFLEDIQSDGGYANPKGFIPFPLDLR